MAQVTNVRRLKGPASDSGERGSFNYVLLLLAVVAVPILVVLGAAQIYRTTFAERIYIGVSVGGVDIGGYTPAEARNVLAAKFQKYAVTTVALRAGDQEWKATPLEMGMRFDVEEAVKSAYSVGRTGGFFTEIRDQLDASRQGESAKQPLFQLDPSQRNVFFDRLSKDINRAPADARLTLLASEMQAKLSPGQPGRTLNVDKTTRRIEEAIALQALTPINLVVDEVPIAVTEAQLQPVQALAQKMMAQPIVAKFEDQSWQIERADIADLLALREQRGANPPLSVEIADQPLQRLVAKMAKTINRRPSNARFDYSNGKLDVIREGIDGRTVDMEATVAALKAQLASDDRTLNLPVKVTKPAFGSADGAKLQIAGVIDQDTTSYAGSIPERAYNVELAASRLHGVVVGPGETFSFNDEVGPVNTLAGYKVGFGITQEGGGAITVPSVGGGICQVASTLFHPVFWAGYPVLDRVPHLYWIPKYGAPPKGLKGLDTTVDQIYDKEGNLVYAVDFTFKNTSPTPILIQSKTDGNSVAFTLLGSKPTWQVKVDPPIIENVVPAITGTLRQVDPTMPPGRTIMIEEAREGFKSTIVRTVTQDGKVIDKKSFVGRYVPTQDVWLSGPPANPTPAPATTPGPKTTPTPSPAGTTTRTPAPTATPTPKR